MKKIILIGITAFAFFISGVVVKAEGEVSVNLLVYINGEAIFSNSLMVSPCTPNSETITPSSTGYCALEQSALSPTWSEFGGDYFLDSLSDTSNDFVNNLYWGWFSNGSYGQTSLLNHALSEGETLLVTFNSNPLQFSASTTTPNFGDDVVFTLEQFGFDAGFNPTWLPVPFGVVTSSSGETFTINELGEVSIEVDFTTPKVFSASIPFGISDESITISPTITPIPVNVSVVSNTETLFDGVVEVTPCSSNNTESNFSYNAFCALSQTGLTLDASWSDFGVFVNGIETTSSDFVNNLYWMWYANLAPGETGMNAYELSSGDQILLAYATVPIRLTASNMTPDIGNTVSITAEYFNTMEWSWQPVSDVIFSVNSVAADVDLDGTYELLIDEDINYTISASKDGLIQSTSLTIDPVAPDTSSGCGACGSGNPPQVSDFNIPSAISFLLANDNADGSFSADLYTDWVSVALGSTSTDVTAIKNYLIADTDPGNLFQDILRRSMALMALGVSPYNGTSRNYIADILSAYDGTQFGDASIFNDDVFALLVLREAGLSSSDPHIVSATNKILDSQSTNGAFIGVDITSATIQALSLVTDIPGVSSALQNATIYLHTVQNQNGGFGNSFSTSWALQAIDALGQTPSEFSVNNKTPLSFLASLQQSDGGIDLVTTSIENRIWATAYAIPGALLMSWSEILDNFQNPFPVTTTGGGDNNVLTTSDPSLDPKIPPLVESPTIEELKIINPEPLVLGFSTKDEGTIFETSYIDQPIEIKKIIDEAPDDLGSDIPLSANVSDAKSGSPIIPIVGGAVIVVGGVVWRLRRKIV